MERILRGFGLEVHQQYSRGNFLPLPVSVNSGSCFCISFFVFHHVDNNDKLSSQLLAVSHAHAF